jgi:pSer/pThr/pTyr-binding forkhead associated (FHA) protein
MSARIQLTLVGLAPPVQHFVFSEPQSCMIGRSPDCGVVLPATIEYCDVSRRHCALRIDPPFVHVRDLGSLNGTFINDDRIGGRSPHAPTLKGNADDEHDWFPLHDGDELRLGQHAILLVDVHEFVADSTEQEARSKDGVGSGTYNAYPD